MAAIDADGHPEIDRGRLVEAHFLWMVSVHDWHEIASELAEELSSSA